MGRPLRIEYPGAIYHITARGNERQSIAFDDRDRAKWLGLLKETVEACNWRMFAFALMDNHFHLFMQTSDGNLSSGMHAFNGSYAKYVNTRHARSGHLFQDRFKDVLIEEEGHWLEVSRYVHLNPVRAGLVSKPEQWKWSSYPGYYWHARRLKWIDYRAVLEEFGGENPSGRRAYRLFVAEGLQKELDSPLSAALHGLVLGSEEFLQHVKRILQARSADEEVTALDQLQQRLRPSLQQVVDTVAEQFGSDPARWKTGGRCNDLGRAVAAYAARRLTGLPAQTIAEALGYRDTSSVSVACRRTRHAMKDHRVAKQVQQLMQDLNH